MTENNQLIKQILTNNSINNSSSVGRHIMETPVLRNSLIIILYSLIVMVSLCANLFVCKVVLLKREFRTTTNLLIVSLSVSDLVMTVFNIPFNLARLLLISWPFGAVLCVLVPFIQTWSVYVSTLTMTVIAVHRYWSVAKPLTQYKFSRLRLISVIITTWILAAILAVPHIVFNRLKGVTLYGMKVTRCRVTYPDVDFAWRPFLDWEVFITQYLVPLLITLVIYSKIGFIIYKDNQLLKPKDDLIRQQSRTKRRVILMLALFVIVFAVCWLPINVYHLIVGYKLIKHNFNLFIFVHWLAMSSVCYNPFIYFTFNESFRTETKRHFFLLIRCHKRIHTSNGETHEMEKTFYSGLDYNQELLPPHPFIHK